MANDSQPQAVTRDDSVDQTTAVSLRSGAAQRQWVYRQRRKHAVIEAIGNEAAASRVALLAPLAHELAVLDGRGHPASANMIGPARNTARHVLNELITRYAIELT